MVRPHRARPGLTRAWAAARTRTRGPPPEPSAPRPLLVALSLWLAAVVAVVIAWFAILFTGRYPRGLFDFVEGVIRWTQRVAAYAFLLVTDRYPPFRLGM